MKQTNIEAGLGEARQYVQRFDKYWLSPQFAHSKLKAYTQNRVVCALSLFHVFVLSRTVTPAFKLARDYNKTS